ASTSQPDDGAVLPFHTTNRCFATIAQPHSNRIGYLCGGGGGVTGQIFAAPVRGCGEAGGLPAVFEPIIAGRGRAGAPRRAAAREVTSNPCRSRSSARAAQR